MQAALKEYWKSFQRSWVHQTGTQLATLTVLAATFTVVGFVFCLSLNLKRVLTHWGESVQLTVYLEDDISAANLEKIKEVMQADSRLKSLEYIPKESATQLFKTQMATYAPELLRDSEFANPFPASLNTRISEKIAPGNIASTLESIAQKLSDYAGVEEVSYGQSWVNNYSTFVRSLSASAWFIVAILVAGSLFVVGNAIRSAISGRRDEIEILELVGATQKMIRAPFLFEGAVMGFTASVIAVALNFGIYLWEIALIKSNFAFARLAANVGFIGLGGTAALLTVGTAIGYFGAYLTVRQINDGWSASQKLES